jgi:hypothetical protein
MDSPAILETMDIAEKTRSALRVFVNEIIKDNDGRPLNDIDYECFLRDFAPNTPVDGMEDGSPEHILYNILDALVYNKLLLVAGWKAKYTVFGDWPGKEVRHPDLFAPSVAADPLAKSAESLTPSYPDPPASSPE